MSKKKINQNLDPYAVDKFATISANFKIWFLKFWIAGAVFYVVVLGIPTIRVDYLDRVVLLILIMTLAYEYIGYTIIIWMDRKDRPTKYHLPHHVTRRKAGSLFATGLYITVITTLVLLFLEVWVGILGFKTIGDILNNATSDPFTFGLIFILFDYLWILVRRLFKKDKDL